MNISPETPDEPLLKIAHRAHVNPTEGTRPIYIGITAPIPVGGTIHYALESCDGNIGSVTVQFTQPNQPMQTQPDVSAHSTNTFAFTGPSGWPVAGPLTITVVDSVEPPLNVTVPLTHSVPTPTCPD